MKYDSMNQDELKRQLSGMKVQWVIMKQNEDTVFEENLEILRKEMEYVKRLIHESNEIDGLVENLGKMKLGMQNANELNKLLQKMNI
eukprot:UN25118